MNVPNLINCHLPFCRLLVSSHKTNIKKLTIKLQSFVDLAHLLNCIPLIEYLNIHLYIDYMLNIVHNREPVAFKFISLKLKHLILKITNDKCYVTELDIFQLKYGDDTVDDSTTYKNDKIDKLCIELANDETNINIEQLKNEIGEIYWNPTVRKTFKYVRSLKVFSDQNGNECMAVDNASLSTILVNLEQLVIWSQLTHLSYYHSRLDLLEILLDSGPNI
ncbi:unnamed protein product [Didymodactylos carnosus]|uniref:Uncharacterized protein n=1 Tax=Didymodactylos carnosus TaxID=1234261 RepID=A0A814DW15_9BILA|nr:unnamed protein product [Didymodactylos carnosus]CAF3735654.1 unnamed protein product [Didymodactylos carnosus]